MKFLTKNLYDDMLISVCKMKMGRLCDIFSFFEVHHNSKTQK